MRLANSVRLAAALVLVIGLSACGSSSPVAPDQSAVPFQTIDLTIGTGATAANGNIVTIIESAWLYSDSATDHKGTLWDSNDQFAIPLGANTTIPGLEQGIVGMNVGGSRRIIVPPSLAYGSNGNSALNIPPNAALVFDVALINVQ